MSRCSEVHVDAAAGRKMVGRKTPAAIGVVTAGLDKSRGERLSPSRAEQIVRRAIPVGIDLRPGRTCQATDPEQRQHQRADSAQHTGQPRHEERVAGADDERLTRIRLTSGI